MFFSLTFLIFFFSLAPKCLPLKHRRALRLFTTRHYRRKPHSFPRFISLFMIPSRQFVRFTASCWCFRPLFTLLFMIVIWYFIISRLSFYSSFVRIFFNLIFATFYYLASSFSFSYNFSFYLFHYDVVTVVIIYLFYSCSVIYQRWFIFYLHTFISLYIFFRNISSLFRFFVSSAHEFIPLFQSLFFWTLILPPIYCSLYIPSICFCFVPHLIFFLNTSCVET